MKAPDLPVAAAVVIAALSAAACGRAVPPDEPVVAASPAAVSAGDETQSLQPETVAPKIVEIESYIDLEQLFDELNYTPEAWIAGIREVPRLYISEIPERWSQHTVQVIDVLTKKRLFFRALAPLVLRSNKLILQERARLLQLAAGFSNGETLQADDLDWLNARAREYRVEERAPDNTGKLFEKLEARIDIIPVSLTLSQAAEESGWGTSRFAFSGNALFGQWTWGEGISPAKQRSGKGDYKIAAFDTPLESVRAHARNLNRHPAYAEFRRQRAILRRAGQSIDGKTLVGNLSRYSERGEAYVESLRVIMRVNNLGAADDAYLADMDPLMLVPVDT